MRNILDEGSIKFKFTLRRGQGPTIKDIIDLEKWRALFYKLGFVGEYPTEKIGYGNISARIIMNQFFITGSQTGHLAHLQQHHYTKVIECDPKKGTVIAEGLIPPSSESLTHYAIYSTNPNVKTVFHIHHNKFWNFLIQNKFPSIESDISYGTIQMAQEMMKISEKTKDNIIVMKGHQDGIIAFGESPEEVGKMILETYRKMGVKQ